MPGSNGMSVLSSQPTDVSAATSYVSKNDVTEDLSNSEQKVGMAPAVVAGLISLGATIIGGVINHFSSKSVNDTRNKEALEQWNRENEYNLPANQMQRLKDAGLNPALMYENGASGLISAQSPDISAAQPLKFGAIDPLSMAQISQMDVLKDAQVKNLEAQTSELNSRVPLNQKQVDKLDADIRQIEESIPLIQANAKLLGNEAVERAITCFREVATFESDVKNSVWNAVSSEFKAHQEMTIAEKLPQQIDATIEQLRSIANLNNANASSTRALLQPTIDNLNELSNQARNLSARYGKDVKHYETQMLHQIIIGYASAIGGVARSIASFKGQ